MLSLLTHTQVFATQRVILLSCWLDESPKTSIVILSGCSLCAGTKGVMQPKRYRKRCEQQIGMSIQENFAPLLRNCAQLAAAEEDTDKRTVRSAPSEILSCVFAEHLNSSKLMKKALPQGN